MNAGQHDAVIISGSFTGCAGEGDDALNAMPYRFGAFTPFVHSDISSISRNQIWPIALGIRRAHPNRRFLGVASYARDTS